MLWCNIQYKTSCTKIKIKLSENIDTSDHQEHENIEYGINENKLYELDKLSLEDSQKE